MEIGELATLGDSAYIKGRIGWKNLKQEEYTEEGPYLIAGKHISNGIIDWNKCVSIYLWSDMMNHLANSIKE